MFTPSFAANVRVIEQEGELIVLGVVTGTPPTTANKFRPGAVLIQGDIAPATTGIYQNSGTAAVPVWTQLVTSEDLTVIDDLNVGGDAVVTGTTTLTGPVNFKRQVTDTGGVYATPIVLTTAQSGRVILVDDASGLDFTLPAIAAGDIGTHFKFLVTTTITANNFRVTAAAGDLLNGGFWISDFDTANTGSYFAADGTDDLVMTMNGSTKGGKKGTWVEFTAISATGWFVQGEVFGDGSLVTPFS